MNYKNECSICYEPLNGEVYNKWGCNHDLFHKHCAETWKKDCPICRCNKMNKKYNNKYFDIDKFIEFAPIMCDDVSKYTEQWKDIKCIERYHKITFHHQYGVTGICHHCSVVQSFNYIV